MINALVSALLLTVFGLFSAAAFAQNIYRCGSTYSQTPCPGGNAVDASDERTRLQKSQTDTNSQRDARTAKSLQAERTKQEAAQSKAMHAPPEKNEAPKKSAPSSGGSASKKKDEYFTARLPDEHKKKKKTTEEKSAQGNKP